MSHFQYEGRRLADSKPTVRSLNDPLGDPFSGLSGAWDSLGKAKSALRRAEFRVSEVEKPSAAEYVEQQDVMSSEPQRDSLVNMDRVPSYSISSQGSWKQKGAPVDNYGRTAYMKEKMRKVSHLDGKYSEDRIDVDADAPRNRSPLRESNVVDPPPSRVHSSHTRDASSDKDKFTTTRYDASHDNSRDTTRSTAVRDTEIRFLNETDNKPGRGFYGGPASKYSRVDVQVPGRRSGDATAAVVKATSVNGSDAGKMSSDVTFSMDGSEDSGSSRVLKKKFRDIGKQRGGLDKVKELIRKQRQYVSSREESDSDNQRSNNMESGQVMTERHRHHDDDPIISKSHGLHEKEGSSHPFRKIASGPPPPSYKGFNETETRSFPIDPLPKKSSETHRKIAPPKPTGERSTGKVDISHKPAVRVVEGQSAKKAPIPRTVAVQKKPSKYDKKDIITTSSWRKGQKLIEEHLGKPKLPRTSDSPPTRDKEANKSTGEHDGSFLEEESSPVGGTMEQHLPTTAKSILADLQSDEERHSESKKERKPGLPREAARKRRSKITKSSSSSGRESKQMKVRHYDSSAVRQYMDKQRADRKKRHQEELDSKRRSEEEKQKKLMELTRKQKEASRSREPSRDNDPRFKQQDSTKVTGSGESDKENREIEGESSDSESDTLTDDSMDGPHSSAREPAKPPIRSSQPPPEKLSSSHPPGGSSAAAASVASSSPADGVTVQDIINKYTQETGLTADDVVSKFAAQAQGIRSTFDKSGKISKPPLPAPTQPTMTSRPYTAPQVVGDQSRSKQERIQALRNTAASLSSRIAKETKQFTDNPADKWAYPPSYGSHEYVSRYQRMEGVDSTVFDTDLPGSRGYPASRYGHHDNRSASAAATTIQAAFRGHSVRRDLGWRVPGHKYVRTGREAVREKSGDDSELTEDLLTDSTDTDESVASNKVKLRGINGGYAKAPAASKKPSKPYTSWDQPDLPDPNNVFTAFSRKQTHRSMDVHPDSVCSLTPDSSKDDLSDASSIPDISPKPDLTSQRSEVRSVRSEGVGHSASTYQDDFLSQHSSSYQISKTRSGVVSERSGGVSERSGVTSERVTGASERSNHTSTVGSRRSGSLYSRGSVDTDGEQEDDTLDGTLTPSLPASDREDEAEVRSGTEAEEKTGGSLSLALSRHSSLPRSSQAEDIGSYNLSDEVNMRPNRASRDPQYVMQGSYKAPALAPGVLESQMMVELSRLESMEESLRQLTDVERTRAVSMAQQETVSLAQILKSRQQSSSLEMQKLHLKTQQESLQASRELEDARRRATEAAATAAQVRSESGMALQESTRKMLETQAEAAKATADAAKQLAEAKAAAFNLPPINIQFPDASQMLGATAEAAAGAAVTAAMRQYQPIGGYSTSRRVTHDDRSAQYSHRSARSPDPSTSHYRTTTVPDTTSFRTTDVSYGSDSFDDGSRSPSLSRDDRQSRKHDSSVSSEVHTESNLSASDRTASVKTASIVTASDTSRGRDGTASSIRTESSIRHRASSPPSKAASIAEEIHSEKDYSVDGFDASLTEDELEKSLRDVLPSAGQRKMIKYEGSRDDLEASFTSDDFSQGGPSSPPSRRMSFESDSFTRFTVDMVRQYMQENEIRAQHQNTLLKLREMALKEKTEAELAWIEQQKLRLRNKGADDQYPNLKKRQRGLIRRLQQHQAEIKKLQEANKAASKERQLLLLQAQEIVKFRQSAKQVRERIKYKHGGAVKGHDLDLDKPSAGALSSDDELSLHMDDDRSLISSLRDDGENLSYSRVRSRSPSESNIQQKLKKLDDKFLTVREQRLQHHKHKSDKNESIHEKDVEDRRGKQTGRERRKEERDLGHPTPRTPRTDRSDMTIATEIPTESLATERPDTARTAKSYSAITEEITTETATSRRTASSIHTEKSDDGSDKRSNDSSDDTVINSSVNESYSHDTFETTDQTQTKTQRSIPASQHPSAAAADKPPTSPDSRLHTLAKEKGLHLKPPKSPRTQQNGRRGESGSESEDSFSMTISETPSDQSDYENRIKALHEELTRRKLEAERLKKEHRRRKKDKMREQEASLKKQIEAYDTYISQVRSELTGDGEVEPLQSSVRPQIKQPMAAESKRLKKPTSPTMDVKPSYSTEVKASLPEVKSRIESESQTGSSADVVLSPVMPDSPSLEVTPTEEPPSPEETLRKPWSHGPPTNQSEVSEDVGEECVTGYSESFEQSHQLKLSLDGSVTEEKPAGSVRAEAKMPDSARTLSEIHEEYSMDTPRSDTAENMSPRRDLDLQTPRSTGPITETEEHSTSYSSTSRQDHTGKDRSYTADFSESKSEMSLSQSSYTRTLSSTTPSTHQDPSRASVTHSKSKPDKMVSVEESIETEEDISEHFDEEDFPEEEESALTFDLQVITLEEPPVITASMKDMLKDFSLGDRVMAHDTKAGILRYKGPMKEEEGFWAGVELDQPQGHSNGVKDNVKYFECAQNHGLFILHHQISREPTQEASIPPALPGTPPPLPSTPPPLPTSAPPTTKPFFTDEDNLDIDDLLSGISEPKSDGQRAREDGEESVTEEMSVATVDSELERVISSAAAAVEEFGDEQQAGEEARATPDDEDAGILEEQPPEDLLTMDFPSTKKSAPPVAQKPDMRRWKESQERNAAETAENTAQNLLNEAISDMISIRNTKLESSPEVEEEKPAEVEKQDILAGFLKQDVGSSNSFLSGLDLEIPGKKGLGEKEGGKSGGSAHDFSSASPTVIKQDDLEKLYEELGSLTGSVEEDGWMDDDFGISTSKHKPPPPYQDKLDKNGFSPAAVDPTKTEPVYAIPHEADQIAPLVDNAVEEFWKQRRYGESWDDMEPPASFFSAEDKAKDIESSSRRVFKKLVFDLVGDILRDMYRDDDDDSGQQNAWSKFKITRGQCSKEKRKPPTTVQSLKPVVMQKAREMLWSGGKRGVTGSDAAGSKKLKWGSRKKKDNVDFVLVEELREEEAGWVNYDSDELAVKVQIADTIFDNLLSETAQVLNSIQQRKV